MNFCRKLNTSMCLLLAAVLLGPGRSAAADEPTKGVDLALVSSVRSIAPSDTFTMGLSIHHHKGFHTYWKNPGAVGYAVRMKWELPEGFTAGGIRWPVPEMSEMAGHPVYGYERDVMLLVDVTAPAELPGGDLEFHADVSWMACSVACNPDSRRFSVTLSTSAKSEVNVETEELFSKAETEVPKKLAGWEAVILTAMDGDKIGFSVTPPAGLADPGKLRVYSSDGQISSSPEPVVSRREDGSYLFEAPRADFSPRGVRSLPFVLVGEKALEDGGRDYGTLDPKYTSGG